jgi:cysteine desulfurase family protein (TIGR01976 family)
MPLDHSIIREQFPALRNQANLASPAVFFDNPGGTQIAQTSLDRVTAYLTQCNANHGGAFSTSQQSDAVLEEAHAAMADFYNAERPEEIIFGNNMTTLTLHISRSLARNWNPGDEIVVTRLDHDANITPWVLQLRIGCTIRYVDFHPEDGTLNIEELRKSLEGKPRLVAVGYASNALGTINPLEQIVQMAHEAGAQVYVDAVQYAAHGPIDVKNLGCDFLVSSAYKFFGTHAGILYGRYELLEELFAYKVRPAPNDLPGKFETGTQNHEGIAGVLGAIEYFEWVGKTFGQDYAEIYSSQFSGRRLYLKQALEAIRAYEFGISQAVLDVLEEIPGVRLYGLRDIHRLTERVPTVSFTLKGWQPRRVAEKLGEAGIYVWDGNYYALATQSGWVGAKRRYGPCRAIHYNNRRSKAVERNFAAFSHRFVIGCPYRSVLAGYPDCSVQDLAFDPALSNSTEKHQQNEQQGIALRTFLPGQLLGLAKLLRSIDIPECQPLWIIELDFFLVQVIQPGFFEPGIHPPFVCLESGFDER